MVATIVTNMHTTIIGSIFISLMVTGREIDIDDDKTVKVIVNDVARTYKSLNDIRGNIVRMSKHDILLMLSNSNDIVRRTTVQAYAERFDNSNFNKLCLYIALSDPELDIRELARRTVEWDESKAPQVVTDLVALLDPKDSQLRLTALFALASLNKFSTNAAHEIAIVQKTYNCENEFVSNAIRRRELLGLARNVFASVSRDHSYALKGAAALIPLGKDLLPVALDYLSKDDNFMQEYSIFIALNIQFNLTDGVMLPSRSDLVITHLIERLTSTKYYSWVSEVNVKASDQKMRMTIIKLLGLFGSEAYSAVPALKDAAKYEGGVLSSSVDHAIDIIVGKTDERK